MRGTDLQRDRQRCRRRPAACLGDGRTDPVRTDGPGGDRGELPLSTRADTKNRRYRVDDSYLRFWLAFLLRGIAESERGRGDLVLSRIERSWTSWRGRAVEPVIRESLARRLPDEAWPETEAVGGWWNRRNRPEIDLVGADRGPGRQTRAFRRNDQMVGYAGVDRRRLSGAGARCGGCPRSGRCSSGGGIQVRIRGWAASGGAMDPRGRRLRVALHAGRPIG
ncbi:MAG TPA: DUF234 domain-containing protein [Candidatus Dormibacteraeota bacterium]|nr:DUF234 domain-containing protein [Candidatus Dormibacteraeota bacterium]